MAREDVSRRVEEILGEFLEERNLAIYRVIFKKEGPDWILRVFLDKPVDSENEYVSIDECEAVNTYLGEKLDEIDLIDRSYKLEVSSPGLDRELIHESDFIRFIGRLVEVKTYEPINGSKNFDGTLAGKAGDVVSIEVAGNVIEIPASKISKINLAVVF